MISSTSVKQRMTVINTTGDFKNSSTYLISSEQAIKFPQTQPRTTANIATTKNMIKAVPLEDLPVINVMISKAKTANNTPIGSTIIPSHLSIFAGRGLNFD